MLLKKVSFDEKRKEKKGQKHNHELGQLGQASAFSYFFSI